MLTILKHINYIKCLCWSIKVKIRIAVFALKGSTDSDTVIYRIWMPYSAIFLMYFLVFPARFRYVCSLELVNPVY